MVLVPDEGAVQEFAAASPDPAFGDRDLGPQAGQPAVDPAVPHPGFTRASRRARAVMFCRVAGRPVLPSLDLVAQRRRTMSRR